MLIPWRPLIEPFDDFDKLFDGLGGKAPIGFMPQIDIYEKGKDLIIEAPMAGIDPEKFEISIEDDILTLKGKMEKKSEVEDKNYYRREIRSGSYYRQIPLPVHVEGDKAHAEYEDGVLKVAVPKLPDKKVKKIDVKVKTKKK